jgi:PKD repeat protein
VTTTSACPHRRTRRAGISLAAAAVLAAAATALQLVGAAPAGAAPPPQAAVTPVAATTTIARDLEQAYAAAAHVPAAAIGGVRAGSLHVASASGTSWAIASFMPSAHATALVRDGFQDGAATGTFVAAAGGRWRLARTGPYGCGLGLPAAVRRAWHLADPPANCGASATSQRAQARRTLAAMKSKTTIFNAPLASQPGAAGSAGFGGSVASQPGAAGSAGPGGSGASAAVASPQAGPADTAASSLGEIIAEAALGQVGVSDTPDVTSFGGVDCNPFSSLVAGFSANDDGCGFDQGFGVENANEEWCSDFAKWAWQQGGVTADMNTLNAGSVSFYDWGLDAGESLAADTGSPQPGDAIVFFPPGAITPTTYADHVGIVTSVNADGTLDMANGDFLGASNISVQYNTGISLTSWAAQTWGTGEQWVIVTPPAAAQQPNPVAWMTGPAAAVTGTTVGFNAGAVEPGGTISQYYWTFGDGRSTNTTGSSVSHVFAEDGVYTVTVTVTSGFGTIRTLTRTVDVLGASSAVASAPSDAVWFANTPTDQYMFVPSGAGGLAADEWDGSSWLQQSVPGQLGAGSGLTALAFPDPAAGDAMTPHAYYRSAAGTLAQTYLGPAGWVTQQLAGQPAPGSAIVATTTPDGPAAFYFTAGGQLTQSAQHGSAWVTSALRGPKASDLAALALADTVGGPVLFYTTGGGRLVASSPTVGSWPLAARAAPGRPLAAVTTPDGRASVFFTDSQGRLAEAGAAPLAAEQTLPGRSAGAGLDATTYLLPGGGLGEEVFYLTAGGVPAVTYSGGQPWQTAALSAALPAAATAVTGANAYQVAGQPSELFLATAAGPAEETAAGPAGPWSVQALPDRPATFADSVVLYAATPSDYSAALGAAAAAGLPASQVTESFATAWDDTLSGSYLVIAVGLAATDGLYFNVCGWDNPSGDIPGSTPFYIAGGPLNQLPGAGAFEEAAAATAAQTPALATDLAYYATHGALPGGVTTLPPEAGAQYACSGQPS